MKVLNESPANWPVALSGDTIPFGPMVQDTASKGLLPHISRIQLPDERILFGLRSLLTDISSVIFQTPNLFAIAIGSSSIGQDRAPFDFPWFEKEGINRAKQKFHALKAEAFDPRTKRERIEGALKLLSDIKPIEGLDKAIWKSIVEETALEDTYDD